ncbi:hypothetical protein RJ641_024644, partial [Dillenia turbinata]
ESLKQGLRKQVRDSEPKQHHGARGYLHPRWDSGYKKNLPLRVKQEMEGMCFILGGKVGLLRDEYKPGNHLQSRLNLGNVAASNAVTTWSGTCYATPLIGAS